MQPRWITYPAGKLRELIESKRPVYVLNTSSLPSGDKGTIIVNFYDGTRREHFKMPPTFIPMAISDVISAKKLDDSRDFKECLQSGMLTLVDPDQAYDYLDSPEAKEEFQNLVLSEHSMKSKSLNVDKSLSRRSQVAHTSNEMAGPQQDVSQVDTVSNKVRGLVESMISQTISAKECLTNLKRHQTALNTTDLSYVIQNSVDAELTHWAKGALNGATVAGGKPQTLVEQPLKQDVATATVPVGELDAFDFDKAGDQMSSDEAAADARAQSEAHANQALHGESKVTTEIDKILGGRKV